MRRTKEEEEGVREIFVVAEEGERSSLMRF